jgi:hypothetical protein
MENQLIENLSEETAAILVLATRHGDIFIVVQLLKTCLFGNQVQFLDIHVGINEPFKLLVEHLESVDMNEVLDILQTHLETTQFVAQAH